MASPGDIVVSRNLYDRLDLALGDEMTLASMGGKTLTARVRGVVRPDSQASSAELLEGYVLVAREGMEQVTSEAQVAEVYIKTRSDEETEAVAERIRRGLKLVDVTTTRDIYQSKHDQFNALSRFLKYTGLLALLIGGIGIINTMQVALSHRRLEIAMLKALGYGGRHIILLFALEAIMLGLVGSLLGLGLSLGLSYLVTSFVLERVGLPLVWDINPLTLVAGFGEGVAVALVFALLPIVTASRIRPYQILREREPTRLRAGVFLNGCLLALLSMIFCVLASAILDSFPWGAAATYGTAIFLILLTLFLGPLIWLVSKLPSLGQIDLKLALRNIGRQKARNISVMLALTISIFALGLTILLGHEVLGSIRQQAAKTSPWNVMLRSDREYQNRIEAQINSLPGLRSYHVGNSTHVEPVVIKGQDMMGILEKLSLEEANSLVASLRSLEGYRLTEMIPQYEITQGRNLAVEDEGQKGILVLDYLQYLQGLHLDVGDTVEVIGQSGDRVALQIVGFYSRGLITADTGLVKISYQTAETISGGNSDFVYWLDVDERDLGGAVRTLNRNLPEAAVVDINDFFAIVEHFLDQLTLIPKVLTLLALFATMVIMANSVALNTLERRREIGIMKAVGASYRRVLAVILLENGVLSALSSTLGVGLAYLFTVGASGMLFKSIPRFNPPIFLSLVAATIAVATATALIAAWGAIKIKPLEVLRYE